jgi:hypothetical protein
VDDFVLVEVFECGDDLGEVVLCLDFGESFSVFDEFVHGVVGADF